MHHYKLWTVTYLLLPLSHGKLVQHALNLTWGPGAPNGQQRDLILTNGQYPGPDLIWDENDDIEVTVYNNLPVNTSVHWHGLGMHTSPWSDGVPGLSQEPIEPGSTFVYKFKASPPGTYWYHSHIRSVMADGQVGSIYIHRAPGTKRPFSLISNDSIDLAQLTAAEKTPNLLMLTDWSSFTSEEFWAAQVASGWDLFCVDSILINGKGAVYCPGWEYLQSLAGEKILPVLNGTNLTDKGCLVPNLPDVQSIYLETGNASAVPHAMSFGCNATDGGIHVVEVDPRDGWASLNFIGGQSLKAMTFSVDNHPMWLYEADGGYVEPHGFEAIQIYNGGRYSVMIKLDQKPGNYSIRVTDQGGDQVIAGFATLSYKNAPADSNTQIIGPYGAGFLDYGGNNVTADVRQLTVEPVAAFGVPPPAATASRIHFTQISRQGAAYLWTLGGRELFNPDELSYTPAITNPNTYLAVDENVAIRTLNDSWVDIVLQVILEEDTPVQPPHPIHKHSNKAYVLAQEVGFFNWTSVAQAIEERPEIFNLKNPPLRDTFVTNFGIPPGAPGAFIVIRYHVTTPGAFLLHCHISSHQQAGMAMAMLDGIDEWPVVPAQYQTGPDGNNGAPM